MLEQTSPKNTIQNSFSGCTSPKRILGPKFLDIRSAVLENFTRFDKNKVGYLTHSDFRVFINETRKSLYLSDADDDIFTEIFNTVDPNNTKSVYRESLHGNFEFIIHLIAKPGKVTENLIRLLFNDFDLKKKGYLKIKQLR